MARLTLENHSGYATEDLRRFFLRGLRALGVRRDKRVVVVSSPIRTRGCATVARDARGSVIVIAIASPSRFSVAKLGRIFEHEVAHAKGLEHEDMRSERLLYSEGPAPAWARGARIRYLGRAPDQMRRLGR